MPSGVYIRTPYALSRLKNRRPGYKHSKETIERIRFSQVGKKCPFLVERNKSIWMKEKVRIAMTGRKLSEETKKKISLIQKGKKLKISTRLKISKALYSRRELSNFWKGGINKLNKAERSGIKYVLWRESVFERDNYTCIWCGKRGGRLQADHIKPFSQFKELRYEIGNGRTLCVECHIKTDTWGGKSNRLYKLDNVV